jgi:hypothetical protein
MNYDFIDCYESDFFVVLIVTQTEMACVSLKKGQSGKILQELQVASDPISVLKAKAPKGMAPRVIPLAKIELITWDDNDHANAVTIRYREASNKPKKTFHSFSSIEMRDQCMEAVEKRLGKLHRELVPAGIWYSGIGPIMGMFFVGLFLVFPATLELIGGGQSSDSGRPRKARAEALLKLFDTLGTGGVLGLAALLIAGLCVKWYLNHRKKPLLTSLRPEAPRAS